MVLLEVLVVFRNLTQHTLNVRLPDGERVILPTGVVARVAVDCAVTREVDGIPVVVRSTGAVVDLPDPQDGVVFLVSTLVLEALAKAGSTRSDVLAPATAPTDNPLRNAAGHIVAVTRLAGLV